MCIKLLNSGFEVGGMSYSPPLFSSSLLLFFFFFSSLLPPFVNYDSEIIQTDFKLCHFFMSVLCLFLDFHLFAGSGYGGISLHYNT